MQIKYRDKLFFIEIVILLLFLTIWIQLFNLQIIKSSGLIAEVEKQLHRKQVFLRGDIRDRNGDLLVLDTVSYDLYRNKCSFEKIKHKDIKIFF